MPVRVNRAPSYEVWRLLSAAGLKWSRSAVSRHDFAIAFFQELRTRMAAKGAPILGLQIVLGQMPRKKAVMAALLDRGIIAPFEMIRRGFHSACRPGLRLSHWRRWRITLASLGVRTSQKTSPRLLGLRTVPTATATWNDRRGFPSDISKETGRLHFDFRYDPIISLALLESRGSRR